MTLLSPKKAVLKATPIETWTKLHRQVMKQIHVYLIFCVLDDNVILYSILLCTLKQDFSILRLLVDETSYFKFDAYRVYNPPWSKWPKTFRGRCNV